MKEARVVDILIATGNPKKAEEIEAVLSEAGPESGCDVQIRWLLLSDVASDLPEPVEDQDTFEGNAALKARYYAEATGLWTLADDSGLEVDALGGEPGVMSARYAAHTEEMSRAERDAANNEKLVSSLRGVADSERGARFRCALALADGGQVLLTAEGVFPGRIVDSPRGENGFGYDPHFLVDGDDRTSAELSPSEKNGISHRGRALQAMRSKLAELLRAEA